MHSTLLLKLFLFVVFFAISRHTTFSDAVKDLDGQKTVLME